MAKIFARTSDNQFIELDMAVAMEFGVVKTFLGEDIDQIIANTNTILPLPNVSLAPLSRIVVYCKTHLEFRAKSASRDEVAAFDDWFVRSHNNDDMYETLLAAHYLNVQGLTDLLYQSVADRIANKSVEYVRELFGVENDFTPEEEAKLREEHPWVFDDVDMDD